MLKSLINKKCEQTDPFGQMLPIRPQFAEIWQVRSVNNTFPYFEYFQGGIGDEPVVFNRRGGWTPQFSFEQNEVYDEPNVADSWCWQYPSNTVFKGYRTKCGGCKRKKCIVMNR